MTQLQKCRAIVRLVTDYYDVTPEALKSKRKDWQLARARWMTCYLLVNVANTTHSEAGTYINKGHSTVTYAIQSLEDEASVDPRVKDQLGCLLRMAKEL